MRVIYYFRSSFVFILFDIGRFATNGRSVSVSVSVAATATAAATAEKKVTSVYYDDDHEHDHDVLFLDITDFGAVGDGITDDTIALQRAITSTSSVVYDDNNNDDDNDRQQRRRIVHVPTNKTFISGPLNLTSNMIFQIDGRLQAIQPPTNLSLSLTSSSMNGNTFANFSWPQLPPLIHYGTSGDAGQYLQYQSFLYSVNASNISIRGNGVVDGMGPSWWNIFKNNPSELPAGRPNLIQFVNCTNVEITGVTLKDSPFWTIHPVQSRNVYIHHMSIQAPMYAPNVDGIDPDSCRNVLIEYNDISCGDDHIAIKSGRCGLGNSRIDPIRCEDDHNFRLGKYKTSNVTIRYNIFRTGMGIALGSELSGGIEDVYVYQNIIGLCEHGHNNEKSSCGWGYGIHFKTTLTRGGFLRNIQFEANTIYNNTGFLHIETNYQSKNNNHPIPPLPPYPTTDISNISFLDNSGLGQAHSMTFACSERIPCNNITVTNNWIMGGARTTRSTNSKSYYQCSYVNSYHIENNSPRGLKECMYNSMNHTVTTTTTTTTTIGTTTPGTTFVRTD